MLGVSSRVHHCSMGTRRILVANELTSYRQAIAIVFRELHPNVEVLEVHPETLDWEVARLSPDLVICSRVTAVVERGLQTGSNSTPSADPSRRSASKENAGLWKTSNSLISSRCALGFCRELPEQCLQPRGEILDLISRTSNLDVDADRRGCACRGIRWGLVHGRGDHGFLPLGSLCGRTVLRGDVFRSLVEGGDQLSGLLFQHTRGLQYLDDGAGAVHHGFVAGLASGVRYVGLDGVVEHSLAQFHGRDNILQELAGRDYRAPVAPDLCVILAR